MLEIPDFSYRLREREVNTKRLNDIILEIIGDTPDLKLAALCKDENLSKLKGVIEEFIAGIHLRKLPGEEERIVTRGKDTIEIV